MTGKGETSPVLNQPVVHGRMTRVSDRHPRLQDRAERMGAGRPPGQHRLSSPYTAVMRKLCSSVRKMCLRGISDD